jgi:hypothetical protein
MKKAALVALAITAVTVSTLAQGTIDFNTRNLANGVDAKVFMADGTTGLGGSGWTAQLFSGPAGAAAADLVAIPGTADFRTSAAGAGYINPIGTVVAAQAGGSAAAVQLRVWDNAGGTVTSWDNAVGVVTAGSSDIITITLGDPSAQPPTPAAALAGLASFSVVVIPEPSTFALLALGAGALFFRRRK